MSITTQQGPITPGQTRVPKVFYGWYIVAAGTVSSFMNMAVYMVGLSVFIKDLRDEMGWSIAAISIGFSLKQFETGLLAPVSGYLIDRVGPRVMAVFGAVVMTIGLLIFANMHSIQIFLLAALVIALGQGMGAHMAYITPVMHWFQRKRGRASSFLAMGRGWGYVGALPITFLLVRYGWRQAATVAAIVSFVVTIPMALVLRHRPEPYGYLPDGARIPPTDDTVPGRTPGPAHDESFTVKAAMHTLPFWMVLLANIFYGFSTSTNHVHMITHMRFTGFSAPAAALVITFYGAVQVVGRLGSGWLGDKMGRHRLLLVSFPMMGVGWVAIAMISPDTLWWSVPLYYLTYGLGQAAHTVTQQTIVADFFGPRRYATIRGVMNPMSVGGGIVGPLFAGFMFDAFESYKLAFFIMGPLITLGAPAIFMAGKPTLTAEPEPAPATERQSSPGN